jgi:pimeloyl-ACP methyl ester carboxylesterase
MSTMIRDGFRQGTTGYIEDWVATFMPWGFRLAEVRGPVTIWWGDEDPLVSRAHTQTLASGVPNARLAVVRGGGHSIAFAEWRSILSSVDVRHG